MNKIFTVGEFAPNKDIEIKKGIVLESSLVSATYPPSIYSTPSGVYKGSGEPKSKIHTTTAYAILAYLNGTDDIAIQSENGNEIINIEYTHESGYVELLHYDRNEMPKTWCRASVVDTLGNYSDYTAPFTLTTGNTGMALFILLVMLAEEDEEFKEHLNALKERYITTGDFANHLAILCDNIYRRVNSGEIATNISSTGIKRLTKTALDSGRFSAEPRMNECKYFTSRKEVKPKKQITVKEAVKIAEFTDYAKSRDFSEYEKTLIPSLDEKIIVSQEAMEICYAIVDSTGTDNPMRNFGLFGEPGSGKTTTAKTIAALLQLPYVVMSCSGGTDEMTLAGGILPETESRSPEEQQEGTKSKSKKVWQNFCSLDDIRFEPSMAYEKLTGVKDADVSSEQVYEWILKNSNLLGDQEKFIYVESPLVQALTKGWVVEIQEPTLIADPRVLPKLNDFIVLGGRLTMDNGITKYRNDDGIAIITSNINCNGCSPMNGSILSRLNLLKIINLPSASVLKKRVIAETKMTETDVLNKMINAMLEINRYCNEHSCFDGSYGYRELVNWVLAYQMNRYTKGKAYASSIDTVQNKVALFEEVRADISLIIKNYFSERE